VKRIAGSLRVRIGGARGPSLRQVGVEQAEDGRAQDQEVAYRLLAAAANELQDTGGPAGIVHGDAKHERDSPLHAPVVARGRYRTVYAGVTRVAEEKPGGRRFDTPVTSWRSGARMLRA